MKSASAFEFGVMLPHRWLYASPKNISEYARLAEDLGYDHVWVTDHVGVPPEHQERGHLFYEALITLSYAAAVTTRIRLGTCVLAASIRNPLLTAKQVSTIDRLSNGRMILGLGTGWIKAETDAFRVNYNRRLEFLLEFIEVLRLAWSRPGGTSHSGKYFNFENLILEPKPVQGRLPILVGGNRPRSVRIAAEVGDGWIPWAIQPRQISEGRPILKGKPIYFSGPAELRSGTRDYEGALGESHHILVAEEAEFSRELESYAEVGVKRFVLSFSDVRLFKDRSFEEIKSQTKDFASGVMKSFKKA
jgi:probable F420-dependent oxidoreductase